MSYRISFFAGDEVVSIRGGFEDRTQAQNYVNSLLPQVTEQNAIQWGFYKTPTRYEIDWEIKESAVINDDFGMD